MKADDDLQKKLRDALSGQLIEIRKRNSQYSLRAFARSLGLTSSSSLSEFLNQKRRFSNKKIRKLVAGPLTNEKVRKDILAALNEDGC